MLKESALVVTMVEFVLAHAVVRQRFWKKKLYIKKNLL